MEVAYDASRPVTRPSGFRAIDVGRLEPLLFVSGGFGCSENLLAGQISRPLQGRQRGVGPNSLQVGMTVGRAGRSPVLQALRVTDCGGGDQQCDRLQSAAKGAPVESYFFDCPPDHIKHARRWVSHTLHWPFLR